ncbi:sulfatase-like hydrolase/transferase [Aquipseudomonas alcaligenes]|uniref:sulfatase-like hydrolase/transferase n=1 Tax=Aquipseudomonas alcaligenes TaxID=43263 RepID=UPI001F005C1B|nr:sulfatase-like hydrolase/transferase [Pseudomonas alcaligenes]
MLLVRQAFNSALLFVFFVLCYWLPFLLDSSAILVSEGRVQQLLDELSALASIQQELLRNGLALLGLLLVVHLACGWVGVRLARKAGLSVFVVRLFLLFVAWLGLMVGNAWIFPWSNYSVAFQSIASPLWALLCFSILFVAFLMVVLPLRRGVLFCFSGIALLMLIGFSLLFFPAGDVRSKAGARNVILIGVDSLSASAFENNSELLPTLSELMGRARRYNRAYTPLGRTFPAWVSILSGKLPAEHGAVFNLRNMEYVERQNLLSSNLRETGYQTMFAIDERRFANIDESFGFDRVVGPKAGALDFALQGLNDNPLSNLLLQTPLAAYLFPYSYMNVAAHANYSASGFVARVLDSLRGDGPLFMAVHFESGHFPFKTRHARREVRRDNRFMGDYLQALTVVDWQVAQLMSGLKQRGVLDDALVILLSDHGEAVGEVETTILRDGEPYEVRSYGHGANLLSDRQNRVFLGVLEFREGRPVGDVGVDSRHVSLLALRPAIESFVSGGDVTLNDGCLIVETGIRLDATQDYHSLREADVAKQAASFYEVDQQGRLRLREDRLPELLATKDIGWRCADRLTWYEPASSRYLAYRLDARGLPVEQLQPGPEDVAHIRAYQERYRSLWGRAR